MRARVVRLVICTGTALCSLTAAHAQTEIRLWPGKAPGSEQWSIAEATTRSPSGDRVITNVSDPTLTVFLLDPNLANGTPRLSINEGDHVAAFGFAASAVTGSAPRSFPLSARPE